MFSRVEQRQLVDAEQYEISVTLEKSASVRGKLDENVPRPVKNGRVVAEIIQPPAQPLSGSGLTWRDWAKIEEDGSFALDGLPRGDVQLIAMCDGFIAESGTAPNRFPKISRR